MADRRLLGLFAHLDDESRIVDGTLARYASERIAFLLLVATRGDEECVLGDPAGLAKFAEGSGSVVAASQPGWRISSGTGPSA